MTRWQYRQKRFGLIGEWRIVKNRNKNNKYKISNWFLFFQAHSRVDDALGIIRVCVRTSYAYGPYITRHLFALQTRPVILFFNGFFKIRFGRGTERFACRKTRELSRHARSHRKRRVAGTPQFAEQIKKYYLPGRAVFVKRQNKYSNVNVCVLFVFPRRRAASVIDGKARAAVYTLQVHPLCRYRSHAAP